MDSYSRLNLGENVGSQLRKEFLSMQGVFSLREIELLSPEGLDPQVLADNPGQTYKVRLTQMKILLDYPRAFTFKELIPVNQHFIEELNNNLAKAAIEVEYRDGVVPPQDMAHFYEVVFIRRPLDIGVLNKIRKRPPVMTPPYMVHMVEPKTIDDILDDLEKKSSFQAVC